MTANDVRAEIERLALALLDSALAIDSNRIVRRSGGHHEWVTWASFQGADVPLYAVPTLDEYLRLVRERQYSILLSDYSFLQLSFEFEHGVATKQRLCFFPCPVVADDDEAREFGIVDYIEALTAEELTERTRLDGPVRVDFDRRSSRVGHSAAHLTICREGCRIPVFGPLSVGHFVRFIFTNFYRPWWEGHAFIREWPVAWLARTLRDEERLQLHVEWQQPLVSRLLTKLRPRR